VKTTDPGVFYLQDAQTSAQNEMRACRDGGWVEEKEEEEYSGIERRVNFIGALTHSVGNPSSILSEGSICSRSRVIDVVTRWNSTLVMLQSLLKLTTLSR
jgi:hypothetical protein